ncbi:Ferric reductase [Klebsormidium nitens]|uniref:Ferric reductase n=1 Tax=Klebsormidium nitens TaxID=105231 RepID=A0A1Y1HYC9_KLENI|nr:Ferric reductase [Klebsormidium nitens]|eukprot:GAQ82742.1 Ferric reductase [Klebsormidium nitens]
MAGIEGKVSPPKERAGGLLFLCGMLRLVLFAIAWACVFAFVFWTVVFNLPKWSWAYQEGDLWQDMRTALNLKNHMMESGHFVVAGYDAQMVILGVLPPFVAAVCVSLARLLPKKEKTRADYKIMVLGQAAHEGVEWVRRSFVWQIPPRRFWLWWSSGMSLGEFLLVFGWIALHFICLWSHKINSWGQFDAWDELGLYYNVPKSVYALDKIAIAWGWILYLDFTLLFFPISHSSFLNYMLGIPFPHLVRYHRWLGHMAMWSLTAHALFYYLYWTANPEINFVHEFFDWGQRYFINLLAGSISWIFGLALWITSLDWIRRKYFELFYKTHIVGFVGLVVFAQMHYYWMWTCWLPGLLLYAADLAVRLCQIQNTSTAIAKGVCEEDSVVMIKLSVDKNIKLAPLQDIFVAFPDISRWQYHPFSIAKAETSSACPMEGSSKEILLSMKRYGKWTSEVIDRLKNGEVLAVRLSGPFGGETSFQWRKYDVVHLYAGGIGVVPLISLLQDMLSARAAGSPDDVPERVVLYWSARHKAEFHLLTKDMAAAIQEGWLTIRLFYTGNESKEQTAKPSFKSSKVDFDMGSVLNERNGVDVGNFNSAPAEGPRADVKLPGASSFFWDYARPIQPKSFNELEALLVILTTWVGGWCGLVLCQSFFAEYVETFYTESKYWKAGLFYTVLLSVMSIGLPVAVVLFPRHLYRYLRYRREDVIQASQLASAEDVYESPDHPSVSATSVSFNELGLEVNVEQGRPDLKSALESIVTNENASMRVAVCCAGPEVMMNNCSNLVSQLNGNDKGVYLQYHRLAYQLLEDNEALRSEGGRYAWCKKAALGRALGRLF